MMVENLITFIRDYYKTDDFVPLHAPVFKGKERENLQDVIDSTFVSSVGAYVDLFEEKIANYTGIASAIATVNGTAALHLSLLLAGVKTGDFVITQPLTFVATCNAISYCGAEPVFVDVDRSSLGMSPSALEDWLDGNAFINDDGDCVVIENKRIVRACLPMHTFGHAANLEGLLAVCSRWNIPLIEDAAESLGSFYKGRHAGTFGFLGVLSFNGNKIITAGGGGMILCDEELALRAKHLSTTAKSSHPYEFFHDEVGYNYRLPNINAALGCAQLDQLDAFVLEKRQLAKLYLEFFRGSEFEFVIEPPECCSNYWLNSIICHNKVERDKLLQLTNERGVMTRPIWTLMTRLPAFEGCIKGSLINAEWLEQRVVNLPSSVRAGYISS